MPGLHEDASCNCVCLAPMQDWAGRAAQLPGHGLYADDESAASGVGRGLSSSGSAPSTSAARQNSAAADMSERSGPPSLVPQPSPSNDHPVEAQAHVDQTGNDDLPISEPLQGQDLEGETASWYVLPCICPGLQQQAQWQQSVHRALACCHGKHQGAGQVPTFHSRKGQCSTVDLHADGAAVTSFPPPKHSASAALANGISAWLAAPSAPEAPSQGVPSQQHAEDDGIMLNIPCWRHELHM